MHGRELRKLGGEIADALEATRDERVFARARARLVETGARAEPPRRAFVLAGVAVAGALAAALVVRAGAHSTAAFELGDPPRAGAVGAEIAASTATPLRFPDGSRFSLEAGGRARTLAAPRAGDATGEGRIALEQGELSGSTARTADAPTWRIVAGPFTVGARTTDFSLSWQPEHGALSVRVVAGAPVTVERDGRSRTIEPGAEQRFDVGAP